MKVRERKDARNRSAIQFLSHITMSSEDTKRMEAG